MNLPQPTSTYPYQPTSITPRWLMGLGRVHSPSMTSVDALLHLRRRLRVAPWPQLRSLWLQWMTRKRRKRWRSNAHSQAPRGAGGAGKGKATRALIAAVHGVKMLSK